MHGEKARTRVRESTRGWRTDDKQKGFFRDGTKCESPFGKWKVKVIILKNRKYEYKACLMNKQSIVICFFGLNLHTVATFDQILLIRCTADQALTLHDSQNVYQFKENKTSQTFVESITLYGCEWWMISNEFRKRYGPFRWILNVSWVAEESKRKMSKRRRSSNWTHFNVT